jgi:hypothetical protein
MVHVSFCTGCQYARLPGEGWCCTAESAVLGQLGNPLRNSLLRSAGSSGLGQCFRHTFGGGCGGQLQAEKSAALPSHVAPSHSCFLHAQQHHNSISHLVPGHLTAIDAWPYGCGRQVPRH